MRVTVYMHSSIQSASTLSSYVGTFINIDDNNITGICAACIYNKYGGVDDRSYI